MKKNIKDLLIDTVLKQIVHDHIYYDKNYIDSLQFNYNDEVIELFNKNVSTITIYNAIEDGLKLKNERGYF